MLHVFCSMTSAACCMSSAGASPNPKAKPHTPCLKAKPHTPYPIPHTPYPKACSLDRRLLPHAPTYARTHARTHMCVCVCVRARTHTHTHTCVAKTRRTHSTQHTTQRDTETHQRTRDLCNGQEASWWVVDVTIVVALVAQVYLCGLPLWSAFSLILRGTCPIV